MTINPVICPAAYAKLSSQEDHAIRFYSDNNGFGDYNGFLRKGLIPKVWKTKATANKEVALLTNGLSKISPSTGQFFRYLDLGGSVVAMPKRFPWGQGVELDLDQLDGFVKGLGNTYADKGFLSTTTNDVASGKFEYTTIQMRLAGKTGRSVVDHTEYENENEFIFLPGTQFQVKMIHGEFVSLSGDNQGEQPDLEQWKAFVKRFPQYFPGVTDQQVEDEFKKFEVPNLIIDLEEKTN